MDAFFASVEQRDNPDLKGKPVAVGSSSARGVVAAASYEARQYGVRSAMPSQTALKKCPSLIFVPHRFAAYKAVSSQIRNIFHDYTDLVEPLSLDEAFLDVTSNKKNMPSATLIAREIKSRIKEETDLTASAGISINKFLAKIASDMEKPDGLYLIPPEKAVQFVEDLPIEKFFGIGKVTAQKMHDMGIKNGLDLKGKTEIELIKKFGKAGKYYYKIARAKDDRVVDSNRIRKSIGAENTFNKDLMELDSVIQEMDKILEILLGRIKRSDSKGKTITVKIKYADFRQITKSKTLNNFVHTEEQIRSIYLELLSNLDLGPGIRLLGLTLSNLFQSEPEKSQSNKQLTIEF